MNEVPASQSLPDPEQGAEAPHTGGVSRRAVLAGVGAASCLALTGYSGHEPPERSRASSLATLGIPSAAAAEAVSGDMIVQKDVPITMLDGLQLLSNVYRPSAAGKYPVIVTTSSYGKDNRPEHWLANMLPRELQLNPGFCSDGSACKYLTWETPDPERWVSRGYVIVNVDSRGSGRSPGYLDIWSAQETRDYYDAIEWAAVQPWSSGKVGVVGLSYYAMMQWLVAALHPPHLAAIVPWEGASDYYRDATHQGGIPSNTFWRDIFWGPIVRRNQHGNPDGFVNGEHRHTNGPLLDPQILPGNRAHMLEQLSEHYLDDEWMRSHCSPILERIEIPLLSAGNWGAMGLHLRGNTEGFQRASSKQKWLNMHTGLHFQAFYSPEGVALQMRFMDHFLKGIDNGWDREPRVKYVARNPHGESIRTAADWPIPGTQWTRFYLDAQSRTLGLRAPRSKSSCSYHAMTSDGVRFTTAPFSKETEITGPLSARLWVSSSTEDMDLFLTLQAFAPDGKEYTFSGSNDPAAPVAQGWLRVSHRKEDPARSLPGRPWHTHDESQKLTPGELYAVNVEIWPTNVVLPEGYRLTLVVEGRDFERPGPAPFVRAGIPFGGSGPYLHTDRDPVQFGGISAIVTGPSHDSYLLLPIIPA